MAVTDTTGAHPWPDGRDRRQCFADTCAPGACGGESGWAVPYLVRAGREITYLPVVLLRVTELSDGPQFSGVLPFVIDTGTSVTTIPRSLLKSRYAFSCDPFDDYEMTDVSGTLIVGRRFRATLAVSPRHSECGVLEFHEVKVFVPDLERRSEDIREDGLRTLRQLPVAFLGLDVLMRVITTFDRSHVRFRQPRPLDSPVQWQR